MAESCIKINNIPRAYKEWFISTQAALKEDGRPSSARDIEKMWLDHMTKNDESGLMAYIHHPDRGARTAIKFNGSGPKETLVLGIKEEAEGIITIATTDGVYSFANGSIESLNTYNSKSVSMPIMENIRMQADSMEISGMTVPFNILSSQMNAYTSYMLVGLAERSGGVIGPYIKKVHAAAKRKNSMYRNTVNLIAEGYRDSELLAKMRVMLKVTGDIDDKQLAKVVTIAYNNARHTKEVLDTKLPKLDKWVQRAFRDSKDQKALNMIFGRGGFMHLLDNTDLIAAINNGETNIDVLRSMIPHTNIQRLEAKELATYMVDGVVGDTGRINSNGSKTIEQLAALEVLSMDKNMSVFTKLKDRQPELYVELLRLSGMVKSLHEVVHSGMRNTVGQGSGKVYTGYDGHGMLDVYDGAHTYKFVTKNNINEVLKDTRYKVIREPKDGGVLGIVARESLNSYQEGIGLDKDVIRNGVLLDSAEVKAQIEAHGKDWLKANNVIVDTDSGYVRYRVALTAKERDINAYKNNIAHTLYRTWVHNAQIVEMQTVQKIVTESMTEYGEIGAKDLERKIGRNNKVEADKRDELKPFLKLNMTYDELKKKYPAVAKRYTPIKNISNYGHMREKIDFVRKDMEDILIGYSTGSMINEDSTFGVPIQRVETVYKHLVQMLKLKLVVANPAKLAMDAVSNTTLLMSMDVGIDEIYKKFPEALKYANEMSNLEGELVSAKIDLAKAEANGEPTGKYKLRVDAVIKSIDKHPFNAAVKNGFIQAQGTSMLVKEFDTISGLQKTIDDVVKLIVEDKKGNPNAMHKGIVGLMNLGFGVDDILNSVSNMSKIKGTSFGQELEGIAERLAEKKNKDVIKEEESKLGRKLSKEEIEEIQKGADVVRYISEFIAAPSSELVRQGSRAMQMADIMSRWTLYTHEVSKGLKDAGYEYVSDYKARQDIKAGKLDAKVYEEIESSAGIKANDTFIDYRINLPKELKVLSDYGILMFPSFWIRAQKVIYNLIKYHPVNAGAGIAVTDLLNLNGASIIDANIINKISNGTAIQAGQNVLDPRTLILGL